MSLHDNYVIGQYVIPGIILLISFEVYNNLSSLHHSPRYQLEILCRHNSSLHWCPHHHYHCCLFLSGHKGCQSAPVGENNHFYLYQYQPVLIICKDMHVIQSIKQFTNRYGEKLYLWNKWTIAPVILKSILPSNPAMSICSFWYVWTPNIGLNKALEF